MKGTCASSVTRTRAFCFAHRRKFQPGCTTLASEMRCRAAGEAHRCDVRSLDAAKRT